MQLLELGWGKASQLPLERLLEHWVQDPSSKVYHSNRQPLSALGYIAPMSYIIREKIPP